MRIFKCLILIICISTLPSCQILKDLINEKTDIPTQSEPRDLVCTPANNTDFNNSHEMIKDKRFDDDRIKSARRETKYLKCLTSEQIRIFAQLITFEDDRLSYAKFAYDHCADPKNYYSTMKPLFRFEDSKIELEKLVRRGR